MNDHEYVEKLLASKKVKRKKTAKQVHNEIFVKSTKKTKKT
jgi:hypothetical protein